MQSYYKNGFLFKIRLKILIESHCGKFVVYVVNLHLLTKLDSENIAFQLNFNQEYIATEGHISSNKYSMI